MTKSSTKYLIMQFTNTVHIGSMLSKGLCIRTTEMIPGAPPTAKLEPLSDNSSNLPLFMLVTNGKKQPDYFLKVKSKDLKLWKYFAHSTSANSLIIYSIHGCNFLASIEISWKFVCPWFTVYAILWCDL